jgi:hypothetical protein
VKFYLYKQLYIKKTFEVNAMTNLIVAWYPDDPKTGLNDWEYHGPYFASHMLVLINDTDIQGMYSILNCILNLTFKFKILLNYPITCTYLNLAYCQVVFVHRLIVLLECIILYFSFFFKKFSFNNNSLFILC